MTGDYNILGVEELADYPLAQKKAKGIPNNVQSKRILPNT
jgi:hypothetical protein